MLGPQCSLGFPNTLALSRIHPKIDATYFKAPLFSLVLWDVEHPRNTLLKEGSEVPLVFPKKRVHVPT